MAAEKILAKDLYRILRPILEPEVKLQGFVRLKASRLVWARPVWVAKFVVSG